jgi:hypothetical protein
MEFPSEKLPKGVEKLPRPGERYEEPTGPSRPEAILEKKEAIAKEGEVTSGPARKFFPFIRKKKEEPILTKSNTLQEIETILVEGLDQYYQSLPEALKEQFKKRGEETASKIEKIIESTKIVVSKIFNLIVSWLRTIPGINKFFVEQEAKIKTDKILALAEKRRREKLL